MPSDVCLFAYVYEVTERMEVQFKGGCIINGRKQIRSKGAIPEISQVGSLAVFFDKIARHRTDYLETMPLGEQVDAETRLIVGTTVGCGMDSRGKVQSRALVFDFLSQP
jgi:hypothetical protein